MPGVGQETAGVREHADKAGQIAKACQRSQLFQYPCLVIVKPPCAALLDFGGSLRILKTAQKGAESLIIIGV